MNETVGSSLNRIQFIALIVGVVAAVLCVLGAFLSGQQFFQSYLFAFLFWMQFSLGCLGLMMVHHLTGGRWGFGIRRLLEAASMTLPLMALLFVPLLFGLSDIYGWADSAKVAKDPILQYKSAYLNPPFFIVRYVLYFVIWFVVAWLLRSWSLRQDRTGEPILTRRMRLLSRGGLVVYVLTVTFATVDWGMSLEPEWTSTIYAAIYITGQGLMALALAVIVSTALRERVTLPEMVSADRFQDLGSLMLAFIILWAYMSFSQLLIMWSGNLPEEVVWYVHRTTGAWKIIVVLLMLIHFLFPLLLLLSRDLKRRPQALALVATLLIVAHLIYLWWMIEPAFYQTGLHISWLDLVAPIAIGGFWIAVFVWQLQGKPLLPRRDPRFQEAFAHEH
jgi:hypothetical protein